MPGDDWSGYARLTRRGYKHVAIAERGDPHPPIRS
jgi:hypothetical protein